MTEMQEYDVIIVGAGLSGGLPCGAYLAKSGAKVLMVDANQEAGTHCKTNRYPWH
jgi:phytoene dehydrogenase-like protein